MTRDEIMALTPEQLRKRICTLETENAALTQEISDKNATYDRKLLSENLIQKSELITTKKQLCTCGDALGLYSDFYDRLLNLFDMDGALHGQATDDVIVEEITTLIERGKWILGTTPPTMEGHYIVHTAPKLAHHFGDWETRTVYECVFSEVGWHTANEVIEWMPLPTVQEAES